MRIIIVSLLAAIGLTGCFTLQATLPEDAVRQHMVQEDDLDLGALCSLDSRSFSEGAVVCMAGSRRVCDPTGRWATDDDRGC